MQDRRDLLAGIGIAARHAVLEMPWETQSRGTRDAADVGARDADVHTLAVL